MDSILVWNVRGANDLAKHSDIKGLISSKKAGMVCLLETKIKNKGMGEFYLRIFSGWCFTNNNPWSNKGRVVLA